MVTLGLTGQPAYLASSKPETLSKYHKWYSKNGTRGCSLTTTLSCIHTHWCTHVCAHTPMNNLTQEAGGRPESLHFSKHREGPLSFLPEDKKTISWPLPSPLDQPAWAIQQLEWQGLPAWQPGAA